MKKAAMFGKLSQLDHCNFRSAKAAMFGLDARIALAIFGALSVISGATLYSAIQQAKTTKTHQIFNEVEKAIEEYTLNTGSFMPEKASNSNVMYIGYLNKNYDSNSLWNGPYIGDGSTLNEHITINNLSGFSYLDTRIKMYRQASSLWSGDDTGAAGACTSGNCYLYVSLYAPSSLADEFNYVIKTFSDLDNYVDGGDGSRTGKVRARITSTSATLYYKAIPDILYLNAN